MSAVEVLALVVGLRVRVRTGHGRVAQRRSYASADIGKLSARELDVLGDQAPHPIGQLGEVRGDSFVQVSSEDPHGRAPNVGTRGQVDNRLVNETTRVLFSNR